ncbi:Nitrilase and fragile histidine triad fusion protein NitFhit [Parelaphostrongylus tenuis]|uniref:Nitrilase and fragile histidine triad fusion protein NitFhit n=1 Tax=Parelaphostrongylus tenuis TaxID=148309 RepID=A0AAD5MSL8_PARTN|nr:Nitrilase and fragile histidine triad fusion protein NitFhit [Parelaphostrongylus tenuis]
MLSASLRRMMSSSSARGRSLIAVCQLTNDHDIERNIDVCKNMVERARSRDCKMIFFPECFDYVGRSKEENISLATEEQGPIMDRFRDLARNYGLWISLGGLHNKDPSEPKLPWNSHIVIDSDGKTRALYNKLHLFDLEIPGKVRLMESEFSKKGSKVVPPVKTPIGRLGLSICYDLRFAELALWNRQKGADILSYPSAFTVNTGLAHWEPLLRARAIESQCYVVAAAQTGKHNEKRFSYGHSMVVDPWGAVIAQCSERVDMCFAEIDLSYVDELRSMQPVFAHRRNDLYSLHVNEVDTEETPMKFAEFPISSDSVFYRSAYSFAFVNLKPVLNGHVLISPKRICYRLTDLSDAETADLFIVAKKVQRMLEKFHNVTSSTVCVQDGPDAGQTVKHVHVHVLARRQGDFGCSPDNLYQNLATHDRDPNVRPRTQEEMTAEAALYRDAMCHI